MSRSLVISLIMAGAVGCQGQSNPFMRTTVPPPATGAGAPTDPYYNNIGRSQPAPSPASAATPASSSVPVPAPVNTTPVVPPPDVRFTQPGGFNFPQGSVLHRKAVDPTSESYRTGTSTIARAARPRSLLGGNRADTSAVANAVHTPAAGELTPETAPEVIQASAEETPAEQPLSVAAAEPATTPVEANSDAAEPQVAQSAEPQPMVTTEPAPVETTMDATASSQGAATMRIVTTEDNTDSAETGPEAGSMPNDTRSPFVTVSKPSASLAVAPPTAASTAPSEATIARTAGEGANGEASRTRFYFDRKQEHYPAKAQPVAFLGNNASGVEFAGGATGNGGTNGEPDGTSAYAYHSQYQWLRGKLEYSSAANRWKLRYIPIDGATDQFGGSVVLPQSPLLEKMRAGEMVTARGTIGNTPAEHGRFAPLYHLNALERQ